MKIAIIDYKAGNLRNVQKAIEVLGVKTDIISSPKKLDSHMGIILPGVGNFKDGMDNLNNSGLSELIKMEVKTFKKPLLGICLGMQLLARNSEEGDPIKGLDLLPAKIKHFDLQNSKNRVPHMGWNDISPSKESVLLKNIPDKTDFYFAHSYHASLEKKDIITSTCNYIYSFASTIEYENIFSTQFHPEKSQTYGSLLIKNFLNYCSEAFEEKC